MLRTLLVFVVSFALIPLGAMLPYPFNCMMAAICGIAIGISGGSILKRIVGVFYRRRDPA